MHRIFYFDTAGIPEGVVTSTARKGSAWFNQVRVGDTVAVHQVQGDCVGYSVVVAKELLRYIEVLDNAEHNSVGRGKSDREARSLLWDTLHAAYGHSDVDDLFSVLHLLPINNHEDISDEIADLAIEEAISEAERVIEAATINVQTAAEAVNFGITQHKKLEAALIEVKQTNDLLFDMVADYIEKEKSEHQRLQAIGAVGITLAGVVKEFGLAGAALVTRVGDIEERVEVSRS